MAARAQPAMPVVGFLAVAPPAPENLAAFRKGLNEQGYVEGRNVVIEFRYAEQYDRFAALATELVRRPVAAIFTSGSNLAARAARSATATIRIVFTIGGDPVRIGLVASYSRPGGNVTGISYLSSELVGKRFELLRELVPQTTTIAFLVNPTNTATELSIDDMQAAARKVGHQVVVWHAGTADEIDTAFATLAQQRPGGLIVASDAFFTGRRNQLIALAARHRIPTVHYTREFAADGGLMSYSDDRLESFRQAGIYVARVLKGEKPGDMPVLQPTKFDFVINLKTAKTLGIAFPPSFHLRATEVIE